MHGSLVIVDVSPVINIRRIKLHLRHCERLKQVLWMCGSMNQCRRSSTISTTRITLAVILPSLFYLHSSTIIWMVQLEWWIIFYDSGSQTVGQGIGRGGRPHTVIEDKGTQSEFQLTLESCNSRMHKVQFRNWVVHHQFSCCHISHCISKGAIYNLSEMSRSTSPCQLRFFSLVF